jgi:regulation of enolase protein 1 (concanavalin A-like superfamily)
MRSPLVFLALAVVLGACGDAQDALDAGVADRGMDLYEAGADAADDATRDASEDALTDQLGEQAAPDLAPPDQASPDQASPDQASPDQASPDQASPDQAVTAPDTLSPDTLSPDTLSPDTLSPDTLSPDTLSPDTLSPDTLSPDTLSPDTLSPDTLSPDIGPPPLLISNVSVGSITRHRATLTFTTNVPTTAIVDYDLDRLSKQVNEASLKTIHSLVLDRLLSNSAQKYQITVTDASLRQVIDQERSFTTTGYAAQALPSGWASQDIGPVSATLPGSASYDASVNGGVFVLRGTGTNVFFAEDSFHFAYHAVSGDFTLTARVDGWYGYLDTFSKAMTMFRVDLTKGSTMFNQSVNYDDEDFLYYRATANANHVLITTSNLNPVAGSAIWVRLRRVGNTFTEYYSTNGSSWTVHGPAGGTVVNLATSGYAGIGVTSKDNGFLTEIVYSKVSLTTP